MAFFFISGGDPAKGEFNEIREHISHYVSSDSTVLVIPLATEERKIANWVATAKLLCNTPGTISILNKEQSSSEMKSLIESHDVLFFTGGRPEKLMDLLRKKDIIGAIKEHPGVLVGVSAGALSFCNQCIITKDDDYPETFCIEGIGLVDFSVEVHYDSSIDEELYRISDSLDLYAIPDGSAILWDKEILMTINRIFYFNKRQKNSIDSTKTITK